MKVSFISTVYNEEKNIKKFIESIFAQTKKPDEVIIVDGGSKDRTVEILGQYVLKTKNKILVFTKKGNRSVGRNEAIRRARGDVIAISDSGNILEKNWLEKITEPFKENKTQVVAGYYKGEAKTVFQKCLVPYVLVMPDRVNDQNFLPATRSMALKKAVWKKVGGFPEKFSHNEDYVFAKKLEDQGVSIKFVQNAIVKWIPRKTLKEAFIMFFRFAYGDSEARIFRNKVFFIFFRYLIFAYLFLFSFFVKSSLLNLFLAVSLCLYIVWAIFKNYKYVNRRRAFIYLPLLQLTSDAAVLSGTTLGFLKLIKLDRLRTIFFKNRGLIVLLIAYILVELLLLPLGIPNESHPFTYFMDEWHQSQSVRNVFRFGTPNIPGSANGSIFQFLLSGIYLIPFQVLGVIDLFSIRSSVEQLSVQNLLFKFFRLNTLFFGISCIVLFAHLSSKYFKLNPFISAFFLVVTPIFIIISNYFKYDIALLFLILLSFLFLLKFARNPNSFNFLVAGFFSGLAFAVKLSAIPLLPIYFISYFLFTSPSQIKLKNLLSGLLVYALVFLLLGIPDVILGKGSLVEYLTSNLSGTPNAISHNYILGTHYFPYLLTKIYPLTFGRPLYFVFLLLLALFLINSFYSLSKFPKIILRNKEYLLLAMALFFFAASLIPLRLEARGNRIIVLLPFMVLTSLSIGYFFINHFKVKFLKISLISMFLLLGSLQTIETFVWVSLKIGQEPRAEASEWILKKIPPGSLIGIENIPIYQMLPDIVVKEFYMSQYGKGANSLYKYAIINSRSRELPHFVVVSNGDFDEKYTKISDKKNLVIRMRRQGYELIGLFKPDFYYFKKLGNELDFFLTSLVIAPNSISIFEKRQTQGKLID